MFKNKNQRWLNDVMLLENFCFAVFNKTFSLEVIAFPQKRPYKNSDQLFFPRESRHGHLQNVAYSKGN